MSLSFTVSAPGKVILNGEHSVVYGGGALAGVIGVRNHLTLTSHAEQSILINLDIFPNNPFAIQLSAFNTFLASLNTELSEKVFASDIDHDVIITKVTDFIHSCGDTSTEYGEPYKKAITAIAYLFTVILYTNTTKPEVKCKEGLVLNYVSGITMGAGLGSSASYGVITAGAFLLLAKELESPNFIESFKKHSNDVQRNDILSQISKWAYCSERIMHGNPSGIDNTVCTFGNVFKFYRGIEPITVKLDTTINILLVNTGVSRSTANVVKRVADLKADHPDLIEFILKAMDKLVDEVVEILENRPHRSKVENYEKLKVLFSINNNLLRAIGVSHPSLEQIFNISEQNGFSCKLTGAGAGGYAIVLLPPSFLGTPNYDNLCSALKEANFQFNETTIGGSGFQIDN